MSYSVHKTPHELAEERMVLAEEFSRYSGALADLIKAQADYFNLHRVDHKSDTALQRAFDVTPEGTQMTIVKLKLKSIQVTLSSIKTLLETLTNESRGLY